MSRFLAVLVAAALPGAASAAERNYTVTDFDQIDVDGNYVVIVQTGRSPAVKATGSSNSLDGLGVEVRSRRLIVRPRKARWGERDFLKTGPVQIAVSAAMLKRVDVSGNGSLTVNRIRSQRFSAGQAGSATLSIGQIEVDQLDLIVSGDGAASLSGKALQGRVSNTGTGKLDAPGLLVHNLDLESGSAGETRIAALDTAKVVSSGQGNVVVSGPAACKVTELGAGSVRCGKDAAQ